MRSALHSLVTIAIATACFGLHAGEVMEVSPEERELLCAFRANPAPFQRVMRGQDSAELLGPRDLIDVQVCGGKIAFYGKRAEFEPVAFRMRRGEVRLIGIRKASGFAETRVRVAYRFDGLHFDVPDSDEGPNLPRGLLVVPESGSWNMADRIVSSDTLSGFRSKSKAEHLEFRIRYVIAR